MDGCGENIEPEPTKMKAKRKKPDATCKARVGLEALTGEKTIQQIDKDFAVHPGQITEWKKKIMAGAVNVFGGELPGAEAGDFDRERQGLHAKIGQLSVEVDFLRKKSKQLGL